MALLGVVKSCSGLRSGFHFDFSPKREEHQKIRQEGLLHMETHEVCFVDDTPLTAEQLQYEVTPPKKQLMIIPKKGQGSKWALYVNHATSPLLVTVDLLDTLLQRLTHRVCALLWHHWWCFGRGGRYTIEDLVIKVKSVCVKAEAAADGDIQHVTYYGLVRALEGNVKEEEDEIEAYFSEDGDSSDDDLEEGSQEDEDGLDLEQLMRQYAAAKRAVHNGCTLGMITTSTLRSQLMAFAKSKGKAQRIEAAHLFGSLLSRDFLSEMSHATQLEEDVGLNGSKLNDSPHFLLPWRPSDTLTMEQPLYAPKAFSCNLSTLQDREAMLDDIWEDAGRAARSFQEDVSRAPALLTIAVNFWRKQVTTLKQKRKEKHEKAKSRKKPRLQQ